MHNESFLPSQSSRYQSSIPESSCYCSKEIPLIGSWLLLWKLHKRADSYHDRASPNPRTRSDRKPRISNAECQTDRIIIPVLLPLQPIKTLVCSVIVFIQTIYVSSFSELVVVTGAMQMFLCFAYHMKNALRHPSATPPPPRLKSWSPETLRIELRRRACSSLLEEEQNLVTKCRLETCVSV
nr:hypothetical protein CFP56_13414 [Quercus suber]